VGQRRVSRRRAHLILFIGVVIACANETSKQFVPLAATLDLPGGIWAELASPEPLRTTAYHHQLCFSPATPFRLAEDPMGVVDEQDKPVTIEAAVSGADGELELPLSAYQGERICFGVSDSDLTREFSHARLRASTSVRIERVEWQSTDK
jgi:hypothetical protein